MLRFGKTFICTALMLASVYGFAQSAATSGLKDGLYAVIDMGLGPITLELYPESAPLTVASFVGLAEGKFMGTGKPYFDGLLFHRVEPGFVVQGGDPTGTGTGGPGYKFPNEIDPKLNYAEEGMLAMANSGPDTNGSQFFITLAPTQALTGSYTIFGRVIKGMEVVKAIRKGERMRTVKIVRIGQKAQGFGMTRTEFDAAVQDKFLGGQSAKKGALKAQVDAAKKRFPGLMDGKSGILYQILQAGNGTKPAARTRVSVHYTLTNLDGKVLDTSKTTGKPLQFSIGAGEMISGFDMSVADMSYGEKRLLVLPPELAYGERGAGGLIPPNSYIVFEVELLAP